MREIKQTIEQEITQYEAFDGTVFSTYDECVKYEETAECAIKARYVKAFGKHKTASTYEDLRALHNCEVYMGGGFNSDDYTFALTFKTQDDIDTLVMYSKFHGTDYADDKYAFEVGKTYIFSGYDTDAFYLMGEVEELKRQAITAIDAVVNDCHCRDCKYCNLEDKHCYNENVFAGRETERERFNMVNERICSRFEFASREEK